MKTLCCANREESGRNMGRAEISRLKAFIFLPFHLSALSEHFQGEGLERGAAQMAAAWPTAATGEKGKFSRARGLQ
jgi:hypothetical protein